MKTKAEVEVKETQELRVGLYSSLSFPLNSLFFFLAVAVIVVVLSLVYCGFFFFFDF